MIDKIMDLFYPPVCGVCGKLDRNWICKKCEITLKKISNDTIEKNDEKYFDEFIYLFKYEGIIRKLILKYKFKDKSYLYRTIIKFILNCKNYCEFLNNYDIIIPVPISIKRYRERGYNQSNLIAREIAKRMNIDYSSKVLLKEKNNVKQSSLNREQRKENSKDVYKLNDFEKIYNKKVLLIDDIYTTGSTVKECCKTLKDAKPSLIGVFTITKD